MVYWHKRGTRMAWDIRNNWADIAELRVDDSVTDSSFAADTEMRLELYTGSYELNLEERRVFVGFNRVMLQLVCHGTEIALGNRYGDNTPQNDIVTKTTDQSNTATRAAADAGVRLDASAALTSMPVKAGVSGEASRSTSSTSETVKVSTSRHVTAKPNGKWEISSLQPNVPLSAKYLTKENVLCEVKPKAKSNRTGVHAHLYAHKSDIVIASHDEKKCLFPLLNGENRNKEKVFKILLGKAMSSGKEDLDKKSYVELSMISSFDSDD